MIGRTGLVIAAVILAFYAGSWWQSQQSISQQQLEDCWAALDYGAEIIAIQDGAMRSVAEGLRAGNEGNVAGQVISAVEVMDAYNRAVAKHQNYLAMADWCEGYGVDGGVEPEILDTVSS